VKTALPVEFKVQQPEGAFLFEAVVTNLSEGGLFAEYFRAVLAERADT
jgi:hypothetical protein